MPSVAFIMGRLRKAGNYMDNNYCVYKHTAPNGKIYIGITSQSPEYRWGRNGSGYVRNKHFYNAIKKYGWDQIKHEIILDKLSQSQACGYEEMFILFYRSNEKEFGYNHTSGGECGFKINDETRERLAEITKELWKKDDWRNNQLQKRTSIEFRKKQAIDAKEKWNNIQTRGKHIKAIKAKWSSQEYKEKQREIYNSAERSKKISDSSKKRWENQEYKEKMKRAAKSSWEGEQGDKRREIIRKNCQERWNNKEYRISHSGKNNKNSKIIFQYDLSNNYIKKYESVAEAAEELNVNSGHISACANGRRKTAYGYIWKYA